MRKIAILFFLVTFLAIKIKAQTEVSPNGLPARYHVTIFTLDGKVISGVLPRSTDSAVFVYGGRFTDWKREESFPITMEKYSNIQKMYVKRRDKVRIGLGIAIGAGLGVIAGGINAASSESESGEEINYTSLALVPIGALVGGVVGSLTKRTFIIDGDRGLYKKFRRKVKTYSRPD